MRSFWIAAFLVFIAEMGDKTQLVALTFAARYRVQDVLAGVFCATVLVHLFSAALGSAAGIALPVFWVKLSAGMAFLIFGIWTLYENGLDREEKQAHTRHGSLVALGTTFFLAELGDKTMLATVTIAGEERNFAGVWLGSTVGMVLADGLAIVAGRVLGRNLSEKPIRYVAAAVFLAYGVLSLWAALARR